MEQSAEAEEGAAEPPSAPPEPAAARDEAPAPERERPTVPAAVSTSNAAPEPAQPPHAAAPPPATRVPPAPPAPEAPREEPAPGPAVVRAARSERFEMPPSFDRNVARPRFDAPPDEPRERPAPAVVRVHYPSPGGPMFGAPPARPREHTETRPLPAFITELADAATQIVRGTADEGTFAFGFYADGNIRFADVDGGTYTGMAESARARMREVDGTRAFTVQIGVATDGRLQATFTGGPHDGQTIALEPLIGWSAA